MDKAMTFNEWLGTQGNMVLLHANCCRIAFEGGQQSMQAKVEELQKQLSEYIFVAETIDEMYMKEVKSSDELQKRVEAFKDHAAMLRSAAKSYAYTEREQNILLSQADDIEKILGLEQRPNGEEQ
ncbi:hypothetical protein [Acinetobacter baumannii]|uniref:hypothetical protein n=1 Tax=Acinetobacter baumannii TaxID=470 RepID=UPI001D189827|nr:hypothetical protein [Acinetobacter baumannii]MDC4768682.1 hypothetical protein [Acinetobacter baumannii]